MDGKGADTPKLFSHKPSKKRASTLGSPSGPPQAGPSPSWSHANPRGPFSAIVRSSFGIFLGLNLILGGYMLFNARGIKSKHSREDRSKDSVEEPKDVSQGKDKKEQKEIKESTSEQERSSKKLQVQSETSVTPQKFHGEDFEYIEPPWVYESMVEPPLDRPIISYQDQMAVLKWILEEKRKERIATRADKKLNDVDKRLLKDLMRSGGHLPLRDL